MLRKGKKKKKKKIFNANLQEQQADLNSETVLQRICTQIWKLILKFWAKSSVTLNNQILFSPYIICIKPIRHAREIYILALVVLFSIKSKQRQYIKIFCFLSLWFLESCWELFLSQNKIPISQENLSSFPFPPHQVFWGRWHDAPIAFRTDPSRCFASTCFPFHLPDCITGSRKIFLIFLSFILIPPVFTEHCLTHSRILVNFSSVLMKTWKY